ncbi:MAG: Na/Pi symporter [Pseudomonadota bacterium]
MTGQEAPSLAHIIGALVAGIGLFFVGLAFLTEHLRSLGGRRLRERIASWTRRPLSGVLWGSVFIALTQSTSAATFVLVGMMRAGLITVTQSLPMIIGVNMAAGLVVLILVMDVKLAILFLLGLSGLLYSSDRARALRSAAGTVFGIALLFFGLGTMQEGVAPLAQTEWFSYLLEWTHDAYLLGFAVGIVLSILVQSSLAVIVIAVALQQAELLDLAESIMVVYGANVGSSFLTLFLSSPLTGQSKQIAMFQTVFNFVGAAILVPLFFVEVMAGIPLVIAFIESIARSDGVEVAFAALIFDWVAGVLLFMFRKPVGAVLARLWPETLVEQISKPRYLHSRMADDPDTALDLIELEQCRLVEYLDHALGALRIGEEQRGRGQTTPEAYQEAFAALDELIEQAMTDVSTQGALSTEAFEHMNHLMSLQRLLQSATEILTDLEGEVADLAQSEVGAHFAEAVVEGLDAILLTLIDVAKNRSEEDARLLELMTADDGNGLTAVRSAYLAQESALDADRRMKLLATANHCERLIWLFGNMGRRYMAIAR